MMKVIQVLWHNRAPSHSCSLIGFMRTRFGGLQFRLRTRNASEKAEWVVKK